MVFMNVNYISRYVAITALFIITQITASDEFSFDQFDQFSDFDVSQSASEESKSFPDAFDNLVTDITEADLSQTRSSCAPGQANLALGVINAFKFQNLLDPSIYKRTLVPQNRNVISLPNTQLVTYQFLPQQQLTTHLFINVTPRKNFRNSEDCITGTNLGSYLNIRTQGLLYTLDEILQSPLFSDEELRAKLNRVDTDKLLWAFEQAKLEERRIGLFFHYYRQLTEKSYFQVKLPVYWMIRNLNYDQEFKNIIQQELGDFLSNGSGSGSGSNSFDENAFARKHLIFDTLGLGILRLTYNHIIYESMNWHLDLGGSLLLPTDFASVQGLYGRDFKQTNNHPDLDICSIAFGENGAQQVQKYFLSALDHLSSILLPYPLGYGKHLGFDLIASLYWQIIPDLAFNTQYCAEFLLPTEVKRFFVPKNRGDFSTIYNDLPQTTQAEQEVKLKLLEARLNELIFPEVHKVKIFPGFILHSTSCLQKTFKNWNLNAGTTTFYQTNEQIQGGLTREEKKLLAIEKSLNETLVQFKAFGKIHRVFHTKRHNDISLSIWADGTLYNNGLGNDFSLGIAFDSKF
jgi:hypothetical protein